MNTQYKTNTDCPGEEFDGEIPHRAAGAKTDRHHHQSNPGFTGRAPGFPRCGALMWRSLQGRCTQYMQQVLEKTACLRRAAA